MSAQDQKTPQQPKAPGRGKVSRGPREQEIENIKRLLANVSQRLNKLK